MNNNNSNNTSNKGVTCVTFLNLQATPTVWESICNLRTRVEEAFPGRCEWMNDDSLHCTIRSMDKL
eukprot:scaffold367_cov202-Alexandrium_tamarense.AAC.26